MPKTIRVIKKLPALQANAQSIYPIVNDKDCPTLIGVVDEIYVDAQHSFLKGRVTPAQQLGSILSPHATNCALIIAANDPVPGGTFDGIDKRAKIISTEIDQSVPSLLNALKSLLRGDHVPNVINISYTLNHPCDSSDENELIALINEANEKNVLICWSADNNATNFDADNTRDCKIRKLPLSLPQKFPNLIIVSNVNQYRNNPSLQSLIDLCAKDQIVIPGQPQPFGGNSAATALVSGVASLLYRAFCVFFTAEQIKNVLISKKNKEGFPILHADHAVKILLNVKGRLSP